MNIDFSSPQVMAILNVTPDSFYAGSRTPEAESVERRVREAVSEGAQLIDVGGYSSRPLGPTKSPPTRSGVASGWASGPCVGWRPA